MRKKQMLALLLSIHMGVASAAPVVYAEEAQAYTQTEIETEIQTEIQTEVQSEMQTEISAAEAEEASAGSSSQYTLASSTEPKDLAPVNNSTALADGTYAISSEQFTFSGGSGKMKITCSSVRVEGGRAYASLAFSSKSIAQVQWAGGSVDGTGIQNIEIPIALNTTNTLGLLTTAMGDPHLVQYQIQVSLAENTSGEEAETESEEVTEEVTEVQTEVQTEIQSELQTELSTEVSTETNTEEETETFTETESEETTEISSETATEAQTETEQQTETESQPETQPASETEKSDTISDGKYTVDPEKIELANGTRMFNIVSCYLTVKNGKITATMELHGQGLDAMFLGTDEEAKKAKSSKYIFADTSGEWYKFTLPVPALDEVITYAARSKRDEAAGTGKLWYTKELIFHSEGIEGLTKPNSSDNSGKNTDNSNPGNNTGSEKDSGNADSTTNGSSSDQGSGSKTPALTKGTSAVNASTGLTDGTYSADSFSWSGGSGKLSISCDRITVRGGSTYATITFTSGKIIYVKASGSKFNPTAQTSSTSTYEIPVALNTNNTIVACTTAMSEPHEVSYSLYIGLEAAKTASNGSSKAGENGDKTDGNVNIKELDDAPSFTGLTYIGTEENDSAEYFRIHHYENGFKVLEISLAEEEPVWGTSSEGMQEETEAEGNSEEDLEEDAEEVSLYEGDVLRYLIVPEGVELPAGLEQELLIVQQPLEHVYVDSAEALNTLEELSLEETIRLIGTSEGEELTLSDTLTKMLEDETILKAAHCDEVGIFKSLIGQEIGLAIVSSDILKEDTAEDEEKAPVQKIGDSLLLLDIPMLPDRSADETDEKGQEEWLRVYGALFDCEDAVHELLETGETEA